MDIFKITTEHKEMVFIIRPLLNAKNLEENIVSYKYYFDHYRWYFRKMCLH